ncbi:MAG: methylmalonyl-CoA mutase small subunit [Prevotellaceae bacterium]|jgi:methylmalonyl-CoA mutase|nr:methylmalonyl-CoA mutase small subunit [Prevotellaceae bacterium]
MSEKKLNLLQEFLPITTEQWMEKITTDLKGADFDKKLVWHTNEGFNVKPFYRAEDTANLQTTAGLPGEFPFLRGTKEDNNWLVCQKIKVTNAAEANKKALDILNKGVNSLHFSINANDVDAKFIEDLLDGIAADAVELKFKLCIRQSPEFVGLLLDYFKSKNYDLSKLEGAILADPMKKMLKKGKDFPKDFVADLLRDIAVAAKELPKYRTANVSAVSLGNAGAYITQELGYALAWGVEYLDMLIDSGIDKAEAAKRIKFTFGVGGNYFMEIAKFRAARLLWAKIVEAYKPESENAAKMHIHATTSKYNKTIFDAYVNMLRTQTEAMSATLGGVDSLTVLGYDFTYQTPDEFSERIARNQQLLLKEESHFDKVTDPSAGSYYIETLTVSIAEQAWKLFLEVQDGGGFHTEVKNGKVQEAVNATHKNRQDALAKRREILLGTNQFPNFNEIASSKLPKEEEKHICGCATKGENEIPTLNKSREAEEFETLRFATENAAKRPKVFMLTIGNLAMRLARAQFSSNFFACAGYEIIDNLGFKTVEEGVEAAQKVGADIIVLCSSDDEYAELAPAAFKAINGKQLFVVAGAPACMDDLKAAGIEYFVNVRSNVLETLKGFNAKLLG